MKKILVISVLFGLLVLPTIGLAQFPWPIGGGGGAPAGPDPNLDVMDVLERIVDWLFTILLVIAAIAIIIAAYYFVTAAGNPEAVLKARNFVLYALIGVAVAVASRGLVALVRTIVGT